MIAASTKLTRKVLLVKQLVLLVDLQTDFKDEKSTMASLLAILIKEEKVLTQDQSELELQAYHEKAKNMSKRLRVYVSFRTQGKELRPL